MSLDKLLWRHEAFLACAPVDRPLLGAWLGGYCPGDQFPRGHGAWRPGQALVPTEVHCATFRDDYERLYRIHQDAEDDFFFVGSAYWGVPWLEAILGCPVQIGADSCWAEPWLHDPQEVARVGADLDANAWFQCLLEFSAELLRLADGRFPVCPPLLRGPGDAARAVCGSERFLLGAIDGDAGIRELLQRCAEVRLEVLRRLHQILPAWLGTHAAGGYPSKVWSARTVSYYQEDAASLLSPTLFAELLLPLARFSQSSADVRFIHLHSSCLYMLDALLADDTFAVIEVNLDMPGSGPSLAEYLPRLRRVQQARRPLLLWGGISADEWELLQRELQPTGLSLQLIVQQPSEMRRYRWGSGHTASA